jgi:Molecular chaperone GrpE (heat shock protein)
MSKSKHKEEHIADNQPTEQVDVNVEAQGDAPAAEEAQATEAAASADTESDEVNKLTAEVGEWKDKYLRLTAEYDNYRKRTRLEMEELRKTAGEKIIKDILGTVDDFERAMQALQGAENSSGLEGVTLIYDKFMGMLKSKGVEVIDRAGEDFDTDFEEAITKFPAPTPEQKGKVIEVIQKGYTLNGKVIRFAKVVVGD